LSVVEAYRALIAANELKADPDQATAAARLGKLEAELRAGPPKNGLLSRLFSKAERAAPRGIYMWGSVGRGKSMLMDLFYEAAPGIPKRRVHFHAFMLEVHAALHKWREQNVDDPILRVADDIAKDVRLLAFDELQVTNVADAMILSRLFTALIAAGTTVVATSNRHPRDLYKDGLNRELFLPFIALLEAELDVIALDGPIDYRLDRMGGMPTYYTPNGPEASAALSELFFRLTDFPVEDRTKVPTAELDVGGGRTLHVPKSLKGVAVFSFRLFGT
jgi:cell division protein ZapE